MSGKSRAPGPDGPALWTAAAVLCLIATADSVWLYYIQLDYDAMAAACGLGKGFDCAPALNSPYGRLFGISLSSYGVAAYALFTLISLQGRRSAAKRPRNSFLLALLALGGSVFCARLAWISTFRLQAYCPYCLVLHILTPIIFLLASILSYRHRALFRSMAQEEWGSLRRDKRLAAGLLLSILFLFVGLPSLYEWKKGRDIAQSSSFQALLDGTFERLPPDTMRAVLSRPVKGRPAAAVTLVEFGDFTCGHCREFRYRFDHLMKEHDVNFVFFPFPRSPECNPSSSDTRPGACYAALVAKHAESRGRFWEVHDAVFDDGTLLDPSRADDLARIAGAANMKEILSDTAARIAVIRDVRLALDIGVKATPTVFVNGMGIMGAPVDWFLKEVIRREEERVKR